MLSEARTASSTGHTALRTKARRASFDFTMSAVPELETYTIRTLPKRCVDSKATSEP